jgi:antitoxin component of MazEF toxin-antitoxin module
LADNLGTTIFENPNQTIFENKIIRFGTEFFLSIPIDLASSLTIKDGDEFEILVNDEMNLILRKKSNTA